MSLRTDQAYPQSATSVFAALFEAGSGSSVVHDFTVDTFAGEVATLSSNTLNGLGYDPVEGHLVGCWSRLVPGAQFFIDQDWDTLTAMAQTAASNLQALAVYPDAPSFDDYFEANLAPYVMGYAYAVAKDGEIIADGGGFARSPQESENPGLPYTADSRMTLASVSKAITGVALEVLAMQKGISLDTPFLPPLSGKVSSNNPVVATITLRNLANMQSGVFQETGEGPADLPAGEDIWTEINNYLGMAPAGTPGQTYYYDNTDYSILQAVIDEVSEVDYTTYVTGNVLVPAGMNPAIINPVPDQPSSATLIYSGPADMSAGYQWPQLTLVGVSGWISSARELVKILAALRGTALLPQSSVNEMFSDSIGWNLPGNPASAPSPPIGNFGTYYWKEGGLHNPSGQSLETFLVRLGEGYDLALLTNSSIETTVSIDDICFNAFDARGLSAANLPANGPLIQTVVHGASFLPAAAPGAFVAIFGSGFASPPATDWSAAIGASNTLPQEVNGVQVRVGSVNAYVEYVSASQVNVLLPGSIPDGIANVQLTTPSGGTTSSLQISPAAPGLFTYSLAGRSYAAAIFGGIPIIVYVAAVGAISGASSQPAKTGDAIQLYGTGMGPTNPPWPDGVTFEQPYPAADLSAFQVMIGGIQSAVLYSGMVEPGLFQINVAIPAGLPAGDQTVVVTVNGAASQPNVFLTVG
jgi:uncharacterized protein (TIGR03437 family)